VLIENEFPMAASADRLWPALLDVERVVPCLPGAALTETVDDRTWKGTMETRLGPVVMTFAGTVTLEERDDVGHRVVLRARGTERRGKGAAEATVTAWLEPGSADPVTTVKLRSDVVLSGAAAQLSRGLLPEISRQLAQRFADCLEASMAVGEAPAPAAELPAPVGGIRLGLRAAWAAISGFVLRLFRRRPGT
jgi:carbon monoxide dehydrogenase subunit G